jgi:hypothetical protein
MYFQCQGSGRDPRYPPVAPDPFIKCPICNGAGRTLLVVWKIQLKMNGISFVPGNEWRSCVTEPLDTPIPLVTAGGSVDPPAPAAVGAGEAELPRYMVWSEVPEHLASRSRISREI